jgi:hypothetical protein
MYGIALAFHHQVFPLTGRPEEKGGAFIQERVKAHPGSISEHGSSACGGVATDGIT